MPQIHSSRRSTRILPRWIVPFFVALLLLLWPLAAFAATIEVDGTTCSLDDAITAANTDSATGGCDAGDAGVDTLNLTEAAYPLATGAYPDPLTVDRALPTITDDLIISGTVGGSTIERTSSSEYGLIYIDEDVSVTLERVVLLNGQVSVAGGAIYNDGHLAMIDS